METKYYCYILKNSVNNRTYNGFTNNPKKRIRQHNREISGGAKATYRDRGNWEIYALLTGFPDKINALQCEWRIKHPNNKRKRPSRYCRPEGRIKGLDEVLKLDKWTSRSTLDNKDQKFKLWIVKDFEKHLTDLPDNIELCVVEKIDLELV